MNLIQYLILIKPSEIRGDEEYVCKVLRMIVNQSIKLDKEIEIPSRKYVVELKTHREIYINISGWSCICPLRERRAMYYE